MKKIIFVPAFILFATILFAQTQHELDSLNNVLTTSKEDSAKVLALCRLSYYDNEPAIRFKLVNEALTLTRKIKFQKGEAQCFHQLGNHYLRIADYSKSMEYYFKALKIRELMNDNESISISRSSIGLIYANQENYKQALSYFFEAEKDLKQVMSPGNSRWPQLYAFIGSAYFRLNNLDSALLYYNRSYESAITAKNKFNLSSSLTGLGNVNEAMGNAGLALSYYKKSIANALEINNTSDIIVTYIALSNLFVKIGNRDSAILYANLALDISMDKQFKRQFVDAAKQLSELNEGTNDKEALRYYKLAMNVKDSIFSASSTAQIQAMTFDEQERQREINQSKLKDLEERKNNLQYAAIAIGLITFLILFFTLSRSIIVKTKFIEFFGVLGLLAVFEFINLFIHPYLSHATNDSPVLMLLILIGIGALLVPLHHRLEKWITKIMVEKNKKIRLAAAKKTIATLENDES